MRSIEDLVLEVDFLQRHDIDIPDIRLDRLEIAASTPEYCCI